MMQVLQDLGLNLPLCVRLHLDNSHGLPILPPVAQSSFFWSYLPPPIKLCLTWHRFLLSIEISAPVTRDTMFCNGFQEVSSPRTNPSPKREQSSWLSLGRQRQAATNQIFQKHLINGSWCCEKTRAQYLSYLYQKKPRATVQILDLLR